MERQEFRAATSLAAVFSVRLLGLFMIYPVFAAYAQQLSGATPYLIGEALGVYGLSQGLLQIPFGLLSDRFGRKRMIVIGLVLFGIGSAVAALSTSIGGVIIGRVLQGAGAVGSVILALVADLTSEESRTKAMATVGITIGASFMVAVVAGPILAHFIGVSGIFWLMVGLALVGIAITEFIVPTPRRVRVHRDAETVPALIGSVLRHRELLRLDIGVFALHAMLTASFLVVPGLLQNTLGLSTQNQWMVYLPVLAVSVVVMVPAIVVAEKYRRMKGVFVASVGVLVASQVIFYFGAGNTYAVLLGLTVFFSAFNIMEASLPSLITKAAPPDAKGTATGLYSSLQFFGIFVGGVVGGLAHQAGGIAGVFILTTVIALLWLLAAATMKQPTYLTTRLLPLGDGQASDAERLAARLRQVPGVAEAVVIAEENLAYLKVDSKSYDAAMAESLAGAR
ncbi:MAG TPA: MFS transporter [Pseudolabrys sp.]|nr:MFS transporter [Pseudolabrys sp.]